MIGIIQNLLFGKGGKIMARYNFTVSQIKNSCIRRMLMLVAFIPLVMLNIIFIIIGMCISGIKHFVDHTKVLLASFKEHW